MLQPHDARCFTAFSARKTSTRALGVRAVLARREAPPLQVVAGVQQQTDGFLFELTGMKKSKEEMQEAAVPWGSHM